ncbi:hypothetical protein LTR70_010539 [Exophiala xenobiotica]|uniref:Heterokaryon incompatibility domain-containing protein n=1 Tax=Lithohypha guttulata TaxID=1690604 RepID=A0ABR0JU09_9EURO|nr:hypothetical protein LTR24_010515 [Lithohypha guttulata]KAK5309176.1 hypothetical protein LTR70_010539 [Exophiala xenobiotica]
MLNKVIPDPSSSQCTTLAVEWMRNCADHHNCAATSSLNLRSSTRFLYLDPNNEDVALVKFLPHQAPREWVALSYRWGTDQAVMLTHSNLAELQEGIQVHDLDHTIQDAIFIVRALGLEYLWVDALCVLQDGSREDWLAQSSKMREVYEKSTVTLVAVDSPSVRHGFLEPRDQQYVPLKWSLESSLDELDASGSLDAYLSEAWDPVRDRLRGPWAERGWTFQEGLLPNRLLYYSATQMLWKCCAETRYERGLKVSPMDEIADDFADEGGRNFWGFDLFTKVKLMPRYVQTLAQDTRGEKHRLWYELVEEYSGRCLGNFSDRSIAISGLAAKYQDFLGTDRYLAGLWKDDIIRGLLWHVVDAKVFDEPNRDGGVDRVWQCPSWSWLGMAAGRTVRNDHAAYMDCRLIARVRDIQIVYEKPSHSFGNVRQAVLSLQGPTLLFNRLYTAGWRSWTSLSAFERHVSHLIEDEHGERAASFAGEGRFAAVLMLQHFPSVDHRLDVLVLEAANGAGAAVPQFRRLGVVRLCYFDEKLKASPGLLTRYRTVQDSLPYRLGLHPGFRRMKITQAKAVFNELSNQRWPDQTLLVT